MRRWAAARPLAVREAPSRQTSVRRTPPDLPCGARPARPLAVHAASFARRVASKPGQALQASRHSPVGPPPFGTADTSPAGLAPPPIGQSHPMSGTKLSQHTTKRLYQAISRLQGELCTAQSTNKPSRENFVPHTGPPPGRNSPRTKPGGPNRYKTLPAGSPNGPPGTKLSQHTTKRRYQAISRLQGELFHAYGRGKPSRERSSPVEWCNRFVSFGVGYALSWSGGSSCWVGWGVSRDLVRMSRLR